MHGKLLYITLIHTAYHNIILKMFNLSAEEIPEIE